MGGGGSSPWNIYIYEDIKVATTDSKDTQIMATTTEDKPLLEGTCMNAVIVEKEVEVREFRPATQLWFACLNVYLQN